MHRLTIIATLLCAVSAFSQDSIGDHYDLSTVTKVKALHYTFSKSEDGLTYFRKLNAEFTEVVEVRHITNLIQNAKTEKNKEIKSKLDPFAPSLCRIVLLDARDNPIAFVSFRERDYSQINRAYKDEGGRIVPHFDEHDFMFYSQELPSLLHKRLQEADPAYLQKIVQAHADSGRQPSWLENGEQAGAGQPATRPESKSEGGDKPQPESEGRSR